MTADLSTLSDVEARVYAMLRERGILTAREVAKALWPEHPAWKRRTKMHRGRTGSVGGTMPMLAGRILRSMETKGWVEPYIPGSNRWMARL